MDPALEIRKFPHTAVVELSKILDNDDSWKRLMSIIPKTLDKTNYQNCDISVTNPVKYNSEHFRILEDASVRYKRSCTGILFYEWGTSGRIRPALGHLFHLLVKAELFRAADYVADELLKTARPKRPHQGPAAQVAVEVKDPKMEEIERVLDEIDYPSSAIEHIKSSIDTNIDHSQKQRPKGVPKIVISESPDYEPATAQAALFQAPVVVQNQRTRGEVSSSNNESSNLIGFSSSIGSSDTANVPQLSALLGQSDSGPVDPPLPNLSIIDDSTAGSSDSDQSAVETSSQSNELPALSALALNSDPNVPELSALDQASRSSHNVPNLSALDQNSVANLPALSALCQSTPNVPDFDQLMAVSSKGSLPTTDGDSRPTASSRSSRQCNSPLPNLSLNTHLPHYTYVQLESATNSFDETPLANGGRFLGSGAFGKVFLAVGFEELGEKPVAVKKLILGDVDVVQVDDAVTKQFRNEVEILSRYKHENLLSLVGYSCDGCTYCLMYEYIPGGALKDRLQSQDNRLIWTDRIYIAKGTAKAIKYLHTEFPTPLIHRDIKTANILLDFTNKPKLCDFGLVKLSPNQNTNTGTTAYGTSAYMAPEAFRGDISVKLDTFSFGVVLLELLTSLPPVDENREGVDLVTHVIDVCEGTIRPLLDTAGGPWIADGVDFAEEIFKIATSCLQEKKRRPSMVEVTSQLEDLMRIS